MCQAYDGERNYMAWSEEFSKQQGYKAFLAGAPKSANPNVENAGYYWSSWDMWNRGWELAKEERKNQTGGAQ